MERAADRGRFALHPNFFLIFFTSTADKNITKSPAAFTMHVAMLHVLGREPGQPASAKAPLSVHDRLEGKLVVKGVSVGGVEMGPV